MTACTHLDFAANIKIGRITEVENGPVKAFVADLTIRCAACGKPFQFLGVQPGLNYDGPTVSLDGLEARLPIVPDGTRPSPFHNLVGYTIKGGRA